MRRARSLRWNGRAKIDLAKIDAYAPGQAERVRDEMERHAVGGWSLGHPIPGTREHWWPIPPWGVLYRVRDSELVVVRVRAVRRMRRPIP